MSSCHSQTTITILFSATSAASNHSVCSINSLYDKLQVKLETRKNRYKLSSRPKYLFTLSDDCTAKMWQITLPQHNDFSDFFIVDKAYNKSILQHTTTFQGHTNSVYGALFGKHSQANYAQYYLHGDIIQTVQLITVSYDSTIRTWDWNTTKSIDEIESDHTIWCVTWWKQGQYLLEAGGRDYNINVRAWWKRELQATVDKETINVLQKKLVQTEQSLQSFLNSQRNDILDQFFYGRLTT